MEGRTNPDGSWTPALDSPHRALTKQEADDVKAMAETAKPIFGGPDNATWEQHHPLAREVFERRGLKPKDAK